MVHGKFFGSFHLDAPVDKNSCGTFLAAKYFCTAVWAAVPIELNVNKMPSCSTIRRVASTVLGGENESSREIRLILRPFTPPFSLTARKYASCARPSIA